MKCEASSELAMSRSAFLIGTRMNLNNEVRLNGVLRNVSMRDRRFWAILTTAGPYTEYVPIVLFASKGEESTAFLHRIAGLADGARIAVAGHLTLQRELDERQQPVLHPRSGHPLRRAEVVVEAFETYTETFSEPAVQAHEPAPVSPVRKQGGALLPPPLVSSRTGVSSRAVNVAVGAGRQVASTSLASLGTPPVPWK